MISQDGFLNLPTFADFDRVVDPDVFHSVPGDWLIGLSDVVNSTTAIAAGGYKAVNLAGAAAISAVMNAIDDEAIAFVFGGDGANFLVAPDNAETARAAMAATATFVKEELSLDLRVAMVPLSAVRAAGHDVLVARYAPTEHVNYAMFSGGGIEWAEGEMKAGRFQIEPAAKGTRPNLQGLSCRWTPIESQRGTILSLIARRMDGAPGEAFARVVRRILYLIDQTDARHGHPVPSVGPTFRFPTAGLELEARASRGDRTLAQRKWVLWLHTLLALVLFRTGWNFREFHPNHYLQQTALNTDFRKFDDGLRMTVDCDATTADNIVALLDDASTAGVVRYGVHRQSAALMTCIVPSVFQDDHMHFLDGADGGYAEAARHLRLSSGIGAKAPP